MAVDKVEVGQIYKYHNKGYNLYARMIKINGNYDYDIKILSENTGLGRAWRYGVLHENCSDNFADKTLWAEVSPSDCIECNGFNLCNRMEVLCVKCRSKK